MSGQVSPVSNNSQFRLGERPLKQYKQPIGGEVHVQTYGYQELSSEENESYLKTMSRQSVDENMRRQVEHSPVGGATTNQLHTHRTRGRGRPENGRETLTLGDDDVTEDYRSSTARETLKQGLNKRNQEEPTAGVPSSHRNSAGVRTGYRPSTADIISHSYVQPSQETEENTKIVAPPKEPVTHSEYPTGDTNGTPDDNMRAGLSSAQLADRKERRNRRPVSQPPSARAEQPPQLPMRRYAHKDHIQLGDGSTPYFETTTRAEYNPASIDPANTRNPLDEAVSPQKPNYRPSSVDPSLGRPQWEVRRPVTHFAPKRNEDSQVQSAIYGTGEQENEQPRTGRKTFANYDARPEEPQRVSSRKVFPNQHTSATAMNEIGAHSSTLDRHRPGDFSGKKIIADHTRSSIILG
eukprot:gb/GECG01002856.1/.p1 GENE.gb/GECG01002856.1/~~gb/GECG01002856.1/.p1  ORF type:complete len:408 (+),score=50.18 gb/GECG01002856.1/:1-1224(+)